MESPSWERIWRELHKRVTRRRGKVPVRVKKIGYSSNVTHGYIDEINYSYKYEDKLLFRNAITVKSDTADPFLKSGDSGALVSFLDSKNEKQALGYGVCEVVESFGDVHFRNEGEQSSLEESESIFICLKLNTALKNLNLPTETGCFRRCGSDQSAD